MYFWGQKIYTLGILFLGKEIGHLTNIFLGL